MFSIFLVYINSSMMSALCVIGKTQPRLNLTWFRRVILSSSADTFCLCRFIVSSFCSICCFSALTCHGNTRVISGKDQNFGTTTGTMIKRDFFPGQFRDTAGKNQFKAISANILGFTTHALYLQVTQTSITFLVAILVQVII